MLKLHWFDFNITHHHHHHHQRHFRVA